MRLLLPLLLACADPTFTGGLRKGGQEGRDSGEPDSASADSADRDSAGPGDSGSPGESAEPPPEDSGLSWEGGLAPYAGCTVGDPEARLLSERLPEGPVSAGAPVEGEVVYANCGASTWLAATALDSSTGVKLGPLSSTVADTWGQLRVLLPADVAPGQAVRITWSGLAPASNGPHGWQWQLLDEWVRLIEAPTPAHSLEVVGGHGPFTVHPREDWQTDDEPVSGPDMELLELEYITIHYNGVAEDLDGDDDIYTDEDAIDRIRNVQSYSIATNDGVSAGYNSYISPDGDEWEIRGHDIRNAASGCPDANFPGYTIVVPTSEPSADPTPAQIEGVKAAILRIRAAAAAAGNPNHLYLNGHRDVAPLCDLATACPGEPLTALLSGGLLEP